MNLLFGIGLTIDIIDRVLEYSKKPLSTPIRFTLGLPPYGL
jgi:hypothetical protein